MAVPTLEEIRQGADCPRALRLVLMQKAARDYRPPRKRTRKPKAGEELQSHIFDTITEEPPEEASFVDVEEMAAAKPAPPKPKRKRRKKAATAKKPVKKSESEEDKPLWMRRWRPGRGTARSIVR